MAEEEEEIVGFGPAAEYLGLRRNTLSAYCSERVDPQTGERKPSTGPKIKGRRMEGQYVLPVFDRSELDRWRDSRPGQGARTDLVKINEE